MPPDDVSSARQSIWAQMTMAEITVYLGCIATAVLSQVIWVFIVRLAGWQPPDAVLILLGLMPLPALCGVLIVIWHVGRRIPWSRRSTGLKLLLAGILLFLLALLALAGVAILLLTSTVPSVPVLISAFGIFLFGIGMALVVAGMLVFSIESERARAGTT